MHMLYRHPQGKPHLPSLDLQETSINASAKGSSVRPAPLWPPALEMGYFGQSRIARPAAAGSKPTTALEALQHHGHGQPQSKSSPPRNSQRRLPSPQMPPALSAQCVTLSGPSMFTYKQAFQPAPRPVRPKTGWRCRSAQRPHSPQHESPSCWSTPPCSSQEAKAAQGGVREGSSFPPGGWGRLTGLALRRQPPHSAVAWPFLHYSLPSFR